RRVTAGTGTVAVGTVGFTTAGFGMDTLGNVPGPVGLGRPRPAGPSTPGGESSPEGSWGVGSNDTQLPSITTCGQAWASLPRITLIPSFGRPGVKPMATRAARPDARASTANAPANCSQDPVRVTVRKVTSGFPPAGTGAVI